MNSILNSILEHYRIFNEEWSYPQTKDFFMVGSPFPSAVLIIFYLMFIHKIGPAFMKNRKPFTLDKVVILYNISQILMNLCLLTTTLIYIYIPMRYNLLCQPVEEGNSPVEILTRQMVWLYFMNKIWDLLDSVFFVLRKKTRQISFLHVYHHSGMIIIGYVGVKYVPGGHSILLGAINAFVHVIMYSYYLTTVFKKDYARNIWWKKHLTQLQLAQFFVILIQHGFVLVLPSCTYPRFISFMVVTQNVFAILLFSDFYYKTYSERPKQK